MEKWIAIRDAFFWWAGVWASITLANRTIALAIPRYRRKLRGVTPFYDQEKDLEPVTRDLASETDANAKEEKP